MREILARLLRLADAALRQLAAGVHGAGGGHRPLLQLADGALDLLGGLAGAAGQLAHLVGHHGKPAALLAGAGRLDGGVEGQQVGLLEMALMTRHPLICITPP